MSKRTDRPPREQQDQLPELGEAHAYQLLLMHDESLQALSDLQEDIDPERARKLAAIRTELLLRQKNVRASED